MINLLTDLYAVFVKTREEHPESVSFLGHICDSKFFFEAIRDKAQSVLDGYESPEAFINAIKRTASQCGWGSEHFGFLGSLLAVCSKSLLDKNQNEFARGLAEESLAHSEIDRFAQDVVLEVNHRLDPSIDGPKQIHEWLKTRFCMFPFTWAEAFLSEEFFCCCPAFVPRSLGSFEDVRKHGILAVLNSPAALEVRNSILDGSFRFCSKLYCPAIGSRDLMSREAGLELVKDVGVWPAEVMLSHDRSCNLFCPSCRKERIVASKEKQKEYDDLAEKVFNPLMDHARLIRITGGGDPFGSNHYRHLIKEYCKRAPKNSRKLNLQTNGVLCDKKGWESLGLYGHVKEVYVSIDAATEKTYSVLRPGGDFRRLMDNMRFLSDLRKKGEIDYFLQRFVVQARNFREMPDFVRMGMEFGVDVVEFNLIRNFGTFTTEEFALENIASCAHPEHGEFLELLKQPIFDYPIARMTNVNNFRSKNAVCAPAQQKAPIKDMIMPFYVVFLRTILDHPEVLSWGGQNINNSELFFRKGEKLVDDLLKSASRDTLLQEIKQGIYDCKLEKFEYIFIGATYAVCAAHFLKAKDYAWAQRLAEEALAFNQMDLFPQNVLLRANHALDPGAPSLEETEAWLKTRFCTRPFTMVETTTSGEIYRCCPSFLPVPIGTLEDVREKGLVGVMNSPSANALKESMIDGSFRFCSKMQCPYIGGRSLMSREDGLQSIKDISPYPEEITFSHDQSCNLSCPSCRTKPFAIPKSQQEKLDSLTDELLLPLMEHGKRISVCGSGDPFASIHFRNLLRRYCANALKGARKLDLQTNGVLCDKKAWDDVGLYGHVREIGISIDAATEPTYNILRRGGNFKRLLENLRFLSGLRRQGEFEMFCLRYVVQARNFREMPALIKLGEELGVDYVEFSQIRNWGTYTPNEFALQNVMSRDHQNHQELLELLNDPIFDHPIVKLGNLANFRSKGA